MRVGLDTSVVVRLLVGEPVAQARAAARALQRHLDAGDVVLVTDLVVVEAYSALHHHYTVPKAEAQDLLRRFIESGVVSLDPEDALPVLATSGGAGLADRLIHARHRRGGATTLTFERKQAKLEGARLVDA